MITKINLDASKINSKERYEKLQNVAIELHTVLNSRYFMDQVLKIKKHGERSKYKDYSNMEIYQILMKGAETFDPVEDNEWDIFVSTYFSLGSAVGKTFKGDKTVYINSKFFDNAHPAEIGSLVVHEMGHHFGFSHDFRRTAERPFSICYQLNECYYKAYSKIYNVYPEVKTVCRRSWKYLWLRKICGEVKSWPKY